MKLSRHFRLLIACFALCLDLGALSTNVFGTPLGVITTFAGTGTAGYLASEDGGTATAAKLNYPSGMAVDSNGNVYIADLYNSRIRKVTPGGVITTVAGNGTAGYLASEDGGQATSASLNYSYGVAVDSIGNIYIADTFNFRIRKVTPGGVITTVAGNGTRGYTGDNGPATSASLNEPRSVAVDSSGNIYIADYVNHSIRKVTPGPGGVITTVAGNGTGILGYTGDNGQATSASLNYPSGVAVDSIGNIYIADFYNDRIRKVDATGVITTFAGNGTLGYSGDNGPATSAMLRNPWGIAVDSSDNIYIADTDNSSIRKVDKLSGNITTVAGNGTAGYFGDGGDATLANLKYPYGVAVDSIGNIYIADSQNYRIRKVQDFTGYTYTVTPSAGAGGGISPATPQTVGYGATTTFIVTPNTGYSIASVAGCNGTLSNNTYTTGAITAGCVVTANFAIDTHTLTYTPGTGGAITGSSPQTVNHSGSGTQVTAVPATGYHFVNWSDNSTTNPRTDTNVTGNITVTANFAIDTHTLNYTAGTGGTITGSSPQAVNHGGSGTQVTAVPATGYHFVSWSDNSTTNPRTDTNVTGNVTVTANFASGSSLGNCTSTNATISSCNEIPPPSENSEEHSGFNPQRAASIGLTGVTGSANICITFNNPPSNNLVFFKFVNHHWKQLYPTNNPPSGISNVTYSNGQICFTIQDNSAADEDNTVGTISDPVVIGTGVALNNAGSASAVTVSTFAGSAGVFGTTNATGTAARFNYPGGIDTDGTNLYVADTNNQTIRKVVIATGAVTTLAGSAGLWGTTDGTGTAGLFYYPHGITTDGTNLYVTDTDNQTIRKVVIATGAVTTLAGSAGVVGSADGTGTAARFYQPEGITTDGTNLYVADTNNQTIRKVVIATGAVTTLAGSVGALGTTDGVGSAARFYNAHGITTDGTHLYVADTSNQTIRKVVIATGAVTTIAGSAGVMGSADGTGLAAQFYNPGGITTDGTNLYVADDAYTIRKVVIATGVVTTLAGSGGVAGSADGAGTVARFYIPHGITTDGTNLYVADTFNQTIRAISRSCGLVGLNSNNGATITYSFEGTLNDPFGTLVVGTPFTGSISYAAAQPNLQHGQAAYRGDYLYQSISLTFGSTTVTDNGSGVINLYDHGTYDGALLDSFGNPGTYPTDLFHLYTYSASGSLGGLTIAPGAGMQLVLQDVTGTAWSSTALPGAGLTMNNLSAGNATFIELRSTQVGSPPNATIARGQLLSCVVAPHILTYTPGTGGAITGSSPQTVNHGSNGSTVTAVPATGYYFVNWSDNSTTNPRTDTNVTGNVTVTANFASGSSLGNCTSTNATVSSCNEISPPSGAPSSFNPQRAASIGLTGVTGSANICINFINPPSGQLVFFKYVNNQWKQLYPGNSLSGISNVTYSNGQICFTIQDNSDADANNAIGTIMDPVVLGINTYTATPSAGFGGSISPNIQQTVNDGSSASFNITPDTGYKINSVTGCGGTLSGGAYITGAITGGGGTYTTGAITGNCTISATFTQSASSTQASFVTGWNLLGNSINAPLDVAATLGDANNVTTVWKWIPATSKWAFYAPSMTTPTLATYAAGKGYDVLTTINGGEGFWVNAKTAFTASLPAGTAISSSAFTDKSTPSNSLPKGWSLIAVGDNPSPRNFANAIAISQPVSPAVAATSLTTLWAWDSGLSSWYFYAPSLDNSGGLANYITTKGYLDFAAKGKTLDPTTGFWVNHP